MSAKWTAADVPDQSGRVAIVTGSNTGIGYGAAAVLADKGAHTVLAVRNLDKGDEAVERIKAASPNATVTLQQLDLTSLDNIRAAADELRAKFGRIDLLINNAGVMYTDKATTKDGFELQFGTNHLGHFALTGQLLDHMLPVEGSRVVTVSSVGHRIRAKIHFDDLNLDNNYNRVVAYGQSKLANLLFTYELGRRLAAKGAADDRDRRAPGRRGHRTAAATCRAASGRSASSSGRPSSRRTPSMGAEPTLRAAPIRVVQNGQYFGPGGLGEQTADTRKSLPQAHSHTTSDIQRRLWTVSEELPA